jgi:hypothetical protein
MLELVLFESRPEALLAAGRGGIDACIVDLEWRGKEERQLGVDTEINRDRPSDLAALLRAGVQRRYCRLDAWGRWTPEQLEAALAAGATDLLLPMVTSAREPAQLQELVDGRARCGVLIETLGALDRAAEIAALQLDLVYVGLNDLAIARQSAHIFVALLDGTADRLRSQFSGTAFGIAGATVVDGGAPVPSRVLLAELARLRCDFTFLRRSFRRDVADRDLATEVARIRELWRQLQARGPEEIAAQRQSLVDAIELGCGQRASA